MEQERRGSPRIPFHLEVEVWGRKGPNTIVDLSASGAFIDVENAFRFSEGDNIDLLLKFPTEEESMLVKAQVARVSDRGIGVRFMDLSPHSSEIVLKVFGLY